MKQWHQRGRIYTANIHPIMFHFNLSTASRCEYFGRTFFFFYFFFILLLSFSIVGRTLMAGTLAILGKGKSPKYEIIEREQKKKKIGTKDDNEIRLLVLYIIILFFAFWISRYWTMINVGTVLYLRWSSNMSKMSHIMFMSKQMIIYKKRNDTIIEINVRVRNSRNVVTFFLYSFYFVGDMWIIYSINKERCTIWSIYLEDKSFNDLLWFTSHLEPRILVQISN